MGVAVVVPETPEAFPVVAKPPTSSRRCPSHGVECRYCLRPRFPLRRPTSLFAQPPVGAGRVREAAPAWPVLEVAFCPCRCHASRFVRGGGCRVRYPCS